MACAESLQRGVSQGGGGKPFARRNSGLYSFDW